MDGGGLLPCELDPNAGRLGRERFDPAYVCVEVALYEREDSVGGS
jgi:hypothetical protein